MKKQDSHDFRRGSIKKIQFLTFTLLFAYTCFLPTSVSTAQRKATLEGHRVAFSPNGQTLASASDDGTVRLWNPNNGKLITTLRGHTDSIWSVVFSPDGQTLASGSFDQTIRLWNPNNGTLKTTLRGHTAGIWSVAFSPDGQTLASASDDGTVRLWNLNNGKLITTLRGHTNVVGSVAFSPEGDILASGSRDTTIRLWNPNNGKHITTLRGHTRDIPGLMFSPDGQTLASGSWDETVRLWNPNNGNHITTLSGKTGGIWSVAFSPDGATLLIGGHGISIWDTQTGEFKNPLAMDIGSVYSIAFSPDGEKVAGGGTDNRVHLYEFNASDYDKPSITTNGMVRLIYFLPNDRPVRTDRMQALGEYIKDTQEFYADEMQRHGYGRKTFTLETDKAGKPIIHHIDGNFPEAYYYKDSVINSVWNDIREHFDTSDFQHIYFIAIDSSSEFNTVSCGEGSPITLSLREGEIRGLDREIIQGEGILGGYAVIPASGDCLKGSIHRHRLGLPAHELGHTFGLGHDFREARNNDHIMGYGNQSRMSKCAAEWLSASRFFNTNPILPDAPTQIQLLSVQANGTETISVRFQVSDHDGLHLAHFLLPEIVENGVVSSYNLYYCEPLNANTSSLEFAVNTAKLVGGVSLRVIDVNGNMTWGTFSIELDAVVFKQNVLDVNGDGIVNILDLVSVSIRFGKTGENTADVNGDGIVNIIDLVKVAGAMGAAAAAPSAFPQTLEMLTAADVKLWLSQAEHAHLTDAISLRGILMLEQLLAALIPKETSLLANYPNPFNPETWIPYQLAEPAAVTVSIHSVEGKLVRTLELGNMPAGVYQSKSRAAYWDGKNSQGETVASSVYFYTLSAGDFSATRKMLIRK